MGLDIAFETVAARHIGAIHASAFGRNEIGPKFRAALDQLWKFVKAKPTFTHHGINIAIYWNEPGTDLFKTPGGLPIDCGVWVPAAFTDIPPIRCVSTPAGRTIKATLIGPYDQIPAAYSALDAAVNEQKLRPAGTCWEVYGHWTEDTSKLTTEVFYLLA